MIKLKGKKLVRKWIKPHKVRGYYKLIKINVNVCFKEKVKLNKEAEK